QKLPVIRVGPGFAVAVVWTIGTAVAEQGVHGVAAQPSGPASLSLGGAQIFICGALVNTKRSGCVARQHAIFDPKLIRVAFVIHRVPRSPCHDIVHPVIKPWWVGWPADRFFG